MDFITSYPILKSFIAGSFSGTFSTILFQPLDLVKTRLQNPVSLTSQFISSNASCTTINKIPKHNGMFQIFMHIFREEQLRGLWRGMTPSITRCVPGVGLYFSSLDWLKSTFTDGNPNPLEAVTLGMVARSMSAAILIPITVIKTRYESGVYQYKSMPYALRHIYRTEGASGLMCGLVPTILRDAPFSGLYLMFYTQTKRFMIPKDSNPCLMPFLHFTSGISAGIFASIVTQPADVIKTKMQLYPNKFKGAFHTVAYIHNQYGIEGFFKGLAPRMLRRTLMAAMAWTVYEQITTWIGIK